jgi:uncharacterized membrane protein YuzA (DUF378 family)
MVELSTKNVAYLVASIGAILWGVFALSDGNTFPLEQLLGLEAGTAELVYAAVGVAGFLSIAYTVAVWDDIDPTVIVVLYLLADLGAVAWGLLYLTDKTPIELLGLDPSGTLAQGLYLAIAAGGVLSILIALSFMDEDSNTTDASDAL